MRTAALAAESAIVSAAPNANEPPSPAETLRFLARRRGTPSRRLAEAVRVRERGDDAPARVPLPDDGDAAWGDTADLEWLVRARAACHPAAPALRQADERLRRASRTLVVVAVLFMTFAGGLAAVAALESQPAGRPVSIAWALLSLLGIQGVLLLAWIALAIARPAPELVTPLAAVAHAAGRRIARVLLRRDDDGGVRLDGDRAVRGAHGDLVAVGEAAAIQWRARGVAGWSLGALAHAGWCAFNAGALVVLVLLLSVRAYAFSCETTILSESSMRTVVRTVAAGPRLIGFRTPDAAAIERSVALGTAASGAEVGAEAGARAEPEAAIGADDEATGNGGGGATAQSPADRSAFAGMLLGSLVLYGFLPRCLLGAWCLHRRRRALAAWRLDLDRAGFARLRPLLVPESAKGRVREEPGMPDAPRPAPREAGDDRDATGAPAGVAIELAGEAEDDAGARSGPNGTGWPPAAAGDFTDLGTADDGAARRDAVERLRGLAPAPRRVLAACSLASTPDRGLGRFLAALDEASGGRLVVVLTDGGVQRRRMSAAALEERTRLWRELLASFGIEADRVAELDLGRPTDAGRALLEALLAGGDRDGADDDPRTERPIDVALDLIAVAASGWEAPPSLEARVALQRAVAEAFGAPDPGAGGPSGLGRLRAVVGLDEEAPAGDLLRSDGLRRAATSIQSRLPSALRAQPRWMAAGAGAGALACLAAASIVSPVALAALPGWSGVGAAIGGLVAAARGGRDAEGRDEGGAAAGDATGETRADAVRSAALLAAVLHLQGRGEGETARRLESALPALDEVERVWSGDGVDEDRLRDALRAVRDGLGTPAGAPS